jgi:hypothetical protein
MVWVCAAGPGSVAGRSHACVVSAHAACHMCVLRGRWQPSGNTTATLLPAQLGTCWHDCSITATASSLKLFQDNSGAAAGRRWVWQQAC